MYSEILNKYKNIWDLKEEDDDVTFDTETMNERCNLTTKHLICFFYMQRYFQDIVHTRTLSTVFLDLIKVVVRKRQHNMSPLETKCRKLDMNDKGLLSRKVNALRGRDIGPVSIPVQWQRDQSVAFVILTVSRREKPFYWLREKYGNIIQK